MKKSLFILFILLMLFVVSGCDSKASTIEEKPISTENYSTTDINLDEQEIAIADNQTNVENETVTEQDIKIIEEEQEENIKQKNPADFSYWVVFKNPDGNELQRTIEKYGATPSYTGDTPLYWDNNNWYKFIGWDKELKPIITNTYITAEYEYGGKLRKEKNITSSNLVTVTFELGGSGYGHMDPNVTSIQVSIGTTYSITGNVITIDGNSYTAYGGPGDGAIENWYYNGTPTTGGQILENATFEIIFYPV